MMLMTVMCNLSENTLYLDRMLLNDIVQYKKSIDCL